jgi:hypothetical protein
VLEKVLEEVSVKHFPQGPYGPPYGIIGDGCLARHWIHYFSLLGLPFKQWSRRLFHSAHEMQSAHWQKTLADCPTLLLAVSDRAIEPLASEIRSTPGFENRTLIHFSGALFSSIAWGFHPLMSFPEALYSLEKYESIPFIIDEGAPEMHEIFPGLKNPSSRLSPQKKALYHAWCVMGGNFTAFLWTQLFESFSQNLELDPKLAIPYLKQVAENLLQEPESARSTWTGPMVRNDFKTIAAHLGALTDHSYQDVYRAFLKAHAFESIPTQGPTQNPTQETSP